MITFGERMESAKEYIEELLKFTLQSHVNETLGFDLCLSKEFCSNLLQDDPDDSFSLPLTPDSSSNCDPFDGVPRYPLFKRLASAIYHSIVSGALCRTYDKAEFSSEDGCLKQKEEEWEKSILEKGTQIMDILKSVSHELHVQEPFFSLLKDGVKTIDGRCAGGIHDRMKPGFVILLNKSVVLEVEAIHHYVSFSKMLEAEGLGKVLPGVETIEEGVKIYRSFYTEERERSNGVLAILVLKLAAQPYLVLASLLSELSYSGLQSLLGLGHTAGSVSGALPPPRSKAVP
ncbi:hypothetical protein K2173_017231 [Erythroxylum novogranatense]|uniref:ASCH domain-containing protein n=1 Tax=Erythroxylum novogranatense TaxID=1862640 RepID=A0AAV8U8X5_9ROSI|nr:hypothetical protein K2173_017231 [Erythroxylum novogranatense]